MLCQFLGQQLNQGYHHCQPCPQHSPALSQGSRWLIPNQLAWTERTSLNHFAISSTLMTLAASSTEQQYRKPLSRSLKSPSTQQLSSLHLNSQLIFSWSTVLVRPVGTQCFWSSANVWVVQPNEGSRSACLRIMNDLPEVLWHWDVGSRIIRQVHGGGLSILVWVLKESIGACGDHKVARQPVQEMKMLDK